MMPSGAMCRFVTLIDVLYEHRIRVFCSAEGEPMDLFVNIMTLQEARTQRSNMVHLLSPALSEPNFDNRHAFDCTQQAQSDLAESHPYHTSLPSWSWTTYLSNMAAIP